MQSALDAIIHSLTGSKALLLRMVADLTPDEWLHRPTPAANCPAWIVGHLATTDRFVAGQIPNAGELPALPPGFEERFKRGTGGADSRDFGDVDALVPLFTRNRDLLIDK